MRASAAAAGAGVEGCSCWEGLRRKLREAGVSMRMCSQRDILRREGGIIRSRLALFLPCVSSRPDLRLPPRSVWSVVELTSNLSEVGGRCQRFLSEYVIQELIYTYLTFICRYKIEYRERIYDEYKIE